MEMARGAQGTPTGQDARLVAPRETHCPQQLSAGMSSRGRYPPALRTTKLPVPTRNNPGWFASYTSRFSARRNAEDGFYLSARRKSRGLAGKFAPFPGGVGGGSGRGTVRYLELQLERRYNQCAPRLRQKCSNCRTLMPSTETRVRRLGDSTCIVRRGETGRAVLAESRCAPTPPLSSPA